MKEYLQYVRKLGFEADPDYAYLRSLFAPRGGGGAPADWARLPRSERGCSSRPAPLTAALTDAIDSPGAAETGGECGDGATTRQEQAENGNTRRTNKRPATAALSPLPPPQRGSPRQASKRKRGLFCGEDLNR